ncbi:hypothetical protein GCG54_00010905 [Colletotrichum gloeosporioides]|uniref:NACHT domain-containing protein n=1 Tax=Colletotrichum gloeosporioides TaxID=474922 RepID=A0A8H4FNQ5_COLGL|nr:uncharacterized protein GCG54_00010905 [Colletotrichum gloeosporioides]KAF3808716.1 hypothetical protein GCG54_00010905 [Colletotrichum gloeosporioides]
MEVFGVLSSVITIVEATSKSYKGIKKIRGLPEAFDTVGQQLNRVKRLLGQIYDQSKSRGASEIDKAQADLLSLTVEECRAKAEALAKVFHDLEEKCNKFEESACVWKDKFNDIYRALLKGSKANRVESLMEDLWKSLQRLSTIEIIGTSNTLKGDAASAIQDLEEVEPSLDDSEFDMGFQPTQKVGAGATGTQTNVKGNDNIFNYGNLPGDFAGSRIDNVHYGGTDYEALLRATRSRLKGTCQWFSEHPEFRNWLSSSEGILLVTAGAGCGKSVLAKYLIEELLHQEAPNATLCYFFFKDGKNKDQGVLEVARALLHCFLESNLKSNPALVDVCMESLRWTPQETRATWIKSPRKIWEVFESLLSEHNKGQTICILDALDESDAGQREELLLYLKRSVAASNTKPRARFIVTTRGYPQIVDMFNDLSRNKVHLDGDDDDEKRQIQSEISIVMEHRLNELGNKMRGLETKTLEIIRQALSKTGSKQRTYLWMHLMFDCIQRTRCSSRKAWAEFCQSLPETVNQAYEKLFQNMESSEKANVRVLLGLILAAEEPLFVQELSIAVSAWKSAFELDQLKISDLLAEREFKDWIQWNCGSFVTFHDRKAYLIHQTAREFLLDQSCFGGWQGSMTKHMVHRYMAESCISVLSLDVHIRDNIPHDQDHSGHTETAVRSSFGTYAARSWGHHFKECQVLLPGTKSIQDVGEKFVEKYMKLGVQITVKESFGKGRFGTPRIQCSETINKYNSKWEKVYKLPSLPWLPDKVFTLSRLACILDHQRLLVFALERLKKNPDPEPESGFYRIVEDFIIGGRRGGNLALPHFAAVGGSTVCLSYLHQNGYNMDLQDQQGNTPLHVAFMINNEEVIETLLQFNVSTTVLNSYDQTPIMLGIICCEGPSWIAEYVQSLNHDDAEMGSLLCSLVALERRIPYEIAEMLKTDSCQLETGAYGRWKKMSWDTSHPLYLFDRLQIEPGLRNAQGLTGLHVSAQKKGLICNLMDLFHLGKVDVDALDPCGNTPLHVAAMTGNYYGAQILIVEGADFNCRGDRGDTPLHLACKNGHYRTAESLLIVGADIEIANDDGLTASECYGPLLYELGLNVLKRGSTGFVGSA